MFHCSMAIDEGDKGGQCIFADIEKFWNIFLLSVIVLWFYDFFRDCRVILLIFWNWWSGGLGSMGLALKFKYCGNFTDKYITVFAKNP